MPAVVSSTLPSLAAAKPGKRPRTAAAGKPEVLEVIEYELIEPCELIQQVRVSPERPARVEESATHPIENVVCGYRIGPLVGRGGMSVVFQVTHPKHTKSLAMKVITDERLQDELAVDTIYGHAMKVAKLASPSIVRTIDAGRLPSGEPFIVMERLEGEDLEERLAEAGPLPFTEAIRFIIQACGGLAEAHEAGIVHGDIKPGNLIVEGSGASAQLKIVDFAPAVPRQSDPSDPLVTCSPGYASPEQLGARRDVDGRADLWALGAVLYELVTGKRAFEASSLPEMLQVIGRVPPSIKSMRADVPAGLDIIVRRCLARDREARYPSVLALREALLALESNHESQVSFAKDAEASARAAATLVARMKPVGSTPPRKPWSPHLGRYIFLAALGPFSTIASMTIVRLVMASSLFAGAPPPPQWPAPAPLAPMSSMATR